MNADEWRLHDELTVRFGHILYAYKHPDVLTDPPTDDGKRRYLTFQFINNDVMARHTLTALVHAAIETTRENPRE